MGAEKRGNTGPRPVAWFEIVGTNGERLRSFHSRLCGWETTEVAPGTEYGVKDATLLASAAGSVPAKRPGDT